MSKHTPEPWTIVVGKYRGNYEIAEAIDSEHEANALLIAAAPKLLEALETHSGICPDPCPHDDCWLAKAAVSEATGQPVPPHPSSESGPRERTP